MLTRTWFHTGAWLQGDRISAQFSSEYYREPGLGPDELDAMRLPDTGLPATVTLPDGTAVPWTLSPDEEREACRSLKGATLRQEIYAQDETARERHPYSVSERSFTIQLLQPVSLNRHAVFFTHARETIDFHYERALYDAGDGNKPVADPRVSHSVTLAVDAYGNPLQGVAVGYGRRYDATDPLLTSEDRATQTKVLATLTENGYTNAVLDEDAYRTPLPAQTRTYELLNVTPPSMSTPRVTTLLRFDDVQRAVQSAGDGQHEIPYEDIDAQSAPGGVPSRRLIEQVRTLYRKDDLSGPCRWPPAPLALPYESYKLAFTPGLLNVLGARISPADAKTLLTGTGGRYEDLDGDGRLWIPSGRVFFSADPTHPDPAFARSHRYLPQGAQDPFGNLSRLSYDEPYELFVAQTVDALGNTATADYDYRVLQPILVTDPNGNRSAVAFDALGLLVATAVMGKDPEPDGRPRGDSLQGVAADLTDAQIDAFFSDPRGQASAVLGPATSRIIYDVHRYSKTGEPAFASTVTREMHVADLQPGQQARVQVSFSYSDGFGREIQKKIPAEPGPIERGGPNVDPRWVGSGWTIFNNKGKPVRQYEPFFTDTHAFEFAILRGVSPILFYDPAMRVVATLHPNHMHEKVLFDPWWQQTWDVTTRHARSVSELATSPPGSPGSTEEYSPS